MSTSLIVTITMGVVSLFAALLGLLRQAMMKYIDAKIEQLEKDQEEIQARMSKQEEFTHDMDTELARFNERQQAISRRVDRIEYNDRVKR